MAMAPITDSDRDLGVLGHVGLMSRLISAGSDDHPHGQQREIGGVPSASSSW